MNNSGWMPAYGLEGGPRRRDAVVVHLFDEHDDRETRRYVLTDSEDRTSLYEITIRKRRRDDLEILCIPDDGRPPWTPIDTTTKGRAGLEIKHHRDDRDRLARQSLFVPWWRILSVEYLRGSFAGRDLPDRFEVWFE